MSVQSEHAPVRLAELVAALSLGIDLGFGQPMEHVLRQCLIALRIADKVPLDEEDRAAVYYTALLVNVGCHADAHEQAKWFGDDIALKADKYFHEPRTVRQAAAMLRRVGGAGNSPLHRIRTGLEFAVTGRRALDGTIVQHARLARALGEQLGLPSAVLDALSGSYERWDGRGWPGVLAGADIPLASRIAQLAEFVEVTHRLGGVDAARGVAERRSGTQFDPTLVSALCTDAETILDDLDEIGSWRAVIDGEPSLTRVLLAHECDAALLANFVDLKSPYTLGHSHAVAELAAAAGRQLGQPDGEVRTLYRAGLVHGECSNSPRRSHPRRGSQCSTRNASTDRATRGAYQQTQYRNRRASSPRPTSTRRCASHDRIVQRARPTKPPPRSAARSAPAAWTPTPSKPS